MSSRLAFEPSAQQLPMLDVFLPMMKSASIIAAGQLELFEALAAGPLSADALAKKLSSSLEGVTRLADFLVTVGYLERTEAGFRNSDQAQQWFTSAGQVNYAAGLQWSANAWVLLTSLVKCVREGAPEETLWQLMEQRETWGPAFSSYMHAFAQQLGPDLIEHVKLPASAKRLLDLGGSHGEHSLSFCKKYPNLEAVIVDQLSALSETANTVEAEGMTSRISLRAGDLTRVPWGEGYDLVLFLSVMHNQSPENNRISIDRISKALTVGGTLVIHEYPTDQPLHPFEAAFTLTLLTETGTRPPSSANIREWLKSAGMSEPRVVPLTPREKGTLFLSTKLA